MALTFFFFLVPEIFKREERRRGRNIWEETERKRQRRRDRGEQTEGNRQREQTEGNRQKGRDSGG
jgi:hypothetical protein